MKALHLSIITLTVILTILGINFNANAQAQQNYPYPHGIGSNSSALYNSVGLSYQQCQNKIGDEIQKTADSLDRGKAVALALTSSEFQSKVTGHKYALTIVSTNDTWDNVQCGDVKLTAVGVGFNLLDTHDTYIESIGVAEDPSLSKVSEVGTTITPICHDNCPLASPPAARSNFIPDIDSDFFLNGHVIPNATTPVGIDLVNTGNSTLYDVHVVFVDSPLLQNYKTAYGNFTLKVGEQKTVMGSMLLPSRISNVSSTLNWMVYANNQAGATGSKEFQRVINLANISQPEYSAGYGTILPPLKQGGPVNGIVCKEGFQLIVKMEDYTPACVTSATFQKLVGRGWGESLDSLLATPLKIEITGLNQSYVSGQPIDATVKYTGYEHGGVYPDMKIVDSNGKQVWSNCCIAHTETPSMAFGTFTYTIEGPAGKPAINETGTYTIIASLDNKTASTKFDVTPVPSIQQNNTGTVNIGNQNFYFTTLNDTLSSYHGVGAIPFTFHGMNFTLFPSVFSAGPSGSCGNTNFGSEVKFTDGTYERLSVHIPGSPCSENYTETVLSNHQNPQAGLQSYQGKIRLLVNTQQTIPNPISNSSNGPEYKVGPDLLGPIPHQLVFFMKSNSTAKIFVEYTSDEPNTGTVPSYSTVYDRKDGNFTPLTTSDVTITANPSSIPMNEGSDTIVVYTVTAKEGAKGVYWIFLVQFCRVMPLAVDINSLTISPTEIPVQTGTMMCPAQFLNGKILGITGGTAEYKIGQPVQ